MVSTDSHRLAQMRRKEGSGVKPKSMKRGSRLLLHHPNRHFLASLFYLYYTCPKSSFSERIPEGESEDHVHRFPQILTDRRAERRTTQCGEERKGAIPALCLLGFTPDPFFLPICVSL